MSDPLDPPRRSPALEAVLAREGAATEERHWVRLTRRCNSRCLFCHDSDRQDGTAVALDAVEADVRAGRARGATRLVLSGGEPTIHPDVVAAIALGRRAGYRWVQVISNGRMFAYERFTARAVAAGLDEVTVSVHGHTPELHDRLTGVPGAFAQAIRGVRNLLAAGRVVSVDVVVSRPNVRHLGDIMALFAPLGVREFDLLYLVPFGRAFDAHRDELFLDPAEARPHVLEALRRAGEPGMHVWTNRWPAPLLEGAEHLIQDPHKLLDEVRGTRAGFESYLATGEPPPCLGERCAHCFLDPFCRALFAERARLVAGGLDVVALDARAAPELHGARREAVARQAGAAYRLAAPSVADAAALLRRLPRADTAPVELDLERLDPVPGALAGRVRRVVLRRAEELERALALGAELEVPLERGTAALARRAAEAAPGRTVITVPGRALLSETVARDLPPAALAGVAGGARAEGLPPCVAPRSAPPPSRLDVALLDGDGRLDLLAWAEAFVRERFRTRSLRCARCAAAARCPGAHVNYVRAHGFGWMAPLAAAGEG